MARSTAATQTPPTEEKAKEPTPREAYDALTEPETPATAFVQEAIGDATDLLDAKKELQDRLQQSRDFLDYAVKSEQATEEQVAWINKYLPKRHRAGSTNGATAEADQADTGDANTE